MDGTIAAIATPIGEGGIGIVRISGSESVNIAKKIFKPKYNHNWFDGPSFKIIYGHVVNADKNEIIDEVLLLFMRSPNSFTGEDVVEISCHGGILVTRKVLELVLENGAVLAGPGEFTKRAFLNGKMDLIQAESVIDIIRAKTDVGLKIFTSQLSGELSQKVNNIQKELLSILAQIEASVDFPEEVEETSRDDLKTKLHRILKNLENLIDTSDLGKLYTEGALVTIVGKPNVGKSSLMNVLLNENRAIVTDVPGTTRDTIEETINIGGMPIKIADTAGLRETDNIVEKIGVERSKDLIKKSDLVLFVLDISGFTDEDEKIFNMVKDMKKIILINKIDTIKDFQNKTLEMIYEVFKDELIIEISAKEKIGLETLRKKIVESMLTNKVSTSNWAVFTKERHKAALKKAKDHIKEAYNDVNNEIPLDLLSINIKSAWELLGEITGEVVAEDLINKIFKDFCIGK